MTRKYKRVLLVLFSVKTTPFITSLPQCGAMVRKVVQLEANFIFDNILLITQILHFNFPSQ